MEIMNFQINIYFIHIDNVVKVIIGVKDPLVQFLIKSKLSRNIMTRLEWQ